jgi:hypothetical protein
MTEGDLPLEKEKVIGYKYMYGADIPITIEGLAYDISNILPNESVVEFFRELEMHYADFGLCEEIAKHFLVACLDTYEMDDDEESIIDSDLLEAAKKLIVIQKARRKVRKDI